MHEIRTRADDEGKASISPDAKNRMRAETLAFQRHNDLERRVKELEEALMPFAAAGKMAIADTSEFQNVRSDDCVNAFKVLYKQ